MKKLILILLTILTVVACGNADKQSIESVIESNNSESIIKMRSDLATQQQDIQTKLVLLDAKLDELNPDKKIPLITSFKATEESFQHFLELQGRVQTKQNIVLMPELSGILSQVFVKNGQHVSKGQLLARIDDGGMSQQLTQMQIRSDLAKTTFERQERLWEQKIGSEIQYLQAKSNFEGQQSAVSQMKSQLAKTGVRAPFSGTIDNVLTEQGSVVSPGQTPLFRIVNLQDMYIETDVPETYLSSVTKDKKVQVSFPVLGKSLDAQIRQAGNFINPNNRTFKIEIDVPNNDNSIKPNLTARLRINDYTNENALLIPQNIISENAEGQQYIYVLKNKENNKAKAQRVIIKTGKTQGDVIEVLVGLNDGDEIIKEGARSVKDGQSVKIITY
ncbi:MAG: membrane fusion protein (multidrug efflux system) [Sediminicola sp.]|jgi:RND family efflux transporter MFP subunit|tara:strand:+ start:1190 stop:2356 length:1167 start_codon:yes stop_codon:yes gene_type:complete